MTGTLGNWEKNSTLYFRPETQYRTYLQLYKAACYVYDHRFELRDIKKRALEGYSNSFLKRVDRGVIEKEFSERVQQLFYDTELLQS